MLRNIILISGVLLTSNVFASQLIADSHVVIGISAGPTWISGNKTQTLNLEPDLLKTYTGSDDNAAFPSAELFVGLQKSLYATSLKQPLLAQIGFVVAGAGNAKLRGNIWDDGDATFNNSRYTYKVNHTYFAIEGRLIGDCNYVIEPYLSASVGVGINHAYDFQITPTIPEEVPAPPFGAHTKSAFSYTLGIGLQKSFTSQFAATIGYEFADWGKINLSRAASQTVNQGLSLNHLYANQLQFSLFYNV